MMLVFGHAKLLPKPASYFVKTPKPRTPNERPDVIIACGQRTKAVAMAVRRRYGAFSVFIHTLSSSELSSFDAMICGEHDKLSGDKILSIIGAVGGIRKSDIDARRASALKKFAAVPTPRVAVLVGGANRAFSFSADDCRTLSDSVIAAVGPGGVLATPSRRTGAPGKSELIKTFAEKGFCWDEIGENPYHDILAAADYIIVSGDSINMLSEAVATAKPVFIYRLPEKNHRAAPKFYDVHKRLVEIGVAKIWNGQLQHWTSPGLDETARAAQFVWEKLMPPKPSLINSCSCPIL